MALILTGCVATTPGAPREPSLGNHTAPFLRVAVAPPPPSGVPGPGERVVLAFDRCLVPLRRAACRAPYRGRDLDLELDAFAMAYHPERFAADEPVLLGPPATESNGDLSYQTAMGVALAAGDEQVLYLAFSVDPAEGLVVAVGATSVWDNSRHPGSSR